MDALLPLGDQAALAYFADEAAALRFAAAVRRADDPWLVDVGQAYRSVAVFFDPGRTGLRPAGRRLRALAADAGRAGEPPEGRLHEIPCCYDLGPDLGRVAE